MIRGIKSIWQIATFLIIGALLVTVLILAESIQAETSSTLSDTGWPKTIVDKGRVFSYTSMAVGSNGRVHIAYGGKQLFYAVWDGSTWRKEEIERGGVGSFCSLALDNSGYPAISYLDKTNNNLKYAHWNGSSWDIMIVDSYYDYAIRTSLAFDPSGKPAISIVGMYYHFNGVSWVKESPGSWWGLLGKGGSLTFNPSGNPAMSLYAMGAVNDSRGEYLFYLYKADGSWTREIVDSMDDVGEYNSLAFDHFGKPAISYYDKPNGELKFARRNGSSWNIETVDSVGDVGKYTSLAFDNLGNAKISYYDETVGFGHMYDNHDLKYAYFNGTSWDIETVDKGGAVGEWTSLAFDPFWNPAISYFDGINEDLKYAHFNGTNWDLETVANQYRIGEYSSLAFDPSGNPAISFLDWSHGSLCYAHWNGSSWEYREVDRGGFVGRWTSLAFDLLGNPAISYYDALSTNGNLKYARFNGTSWDVETVDSAGTTGWYTSLAFDSSGNPAISYCALDNVRFARWNGTSWDIQTVDSGCESSLAFDASGNPAISYDGKYAHWNGTSWNIEIVDSEGSSYNTSLAFDSSGNPAIGYYVNGDLMYAYFNGTSWDIETADSEGDVGQYSSLAFNIKGSPTISYYDATNGDLKYAIKYVTQPPHQPNNISPSDGSTNISLTPTLESSAFFDPDTGDTHTASHWQITTISGDYSSPVFDSGADSSNLTSITIPSGILWYSTTYYWRVKHQDNHGTWSEYSLEIIFTTTTLPGAEWDKIFGGLSDDEACSVKQTSDGGYIVVGQTYSYDIGSGDVWLIKTDSEGNLQWDKTFGGAKADYGDAVQQTLDGGYIIVGSTFSYGAGETDVWLIKTDSNGNQQWDRTFGGEGYEWGSSVQQTLDGGYIIAGENGLNGDVWLIKVDSEGNRQWDKTSVRGWGSSVQQTLDGGYIITGWTPSEDGLLIKVDSEGNEEWNKKFGESGDDRGISVEQTSDGGYIVVGLVGKTYNIGSGDIWLIKTDSSGNQQWDKTFGGAEADYGNAVQQTLDGGYIIVGFTSSYGAGETDVWLIKIDSSGNQQWDKTFGGAEADYGNAVQQTLDGGYIIAGSVSSNGAGMGDVWLIKVAGEKVANQPPTASFTCSPENPPVGEKITFNASSSSDPDGEIVSYEWDFGDGNAGSGEVVNHTYSNPGDYTVTLTVKDNIGTESSKSETITVFLYGDVSDDGKVKAYDASLVLQHVVGLLNIEPDSEQWRAADVSGNSNISAYDAALILQYCVGLITKFPADTPAAAPALDQKSEDKLLAEAVAQLETVSLSNEQNRILEQLKLLVFNKLVSPCTSLLQNFPNPFNPETWIPYTLTEGVHVTIEIYNATGTLVRTLDLGYKDAGYYLEKNKAAYWNGRNNVGETVSSGVYFYRLKAGDFTATKKLVVLR